MFVADFTSMVPEMQFGLVQEEITQAFKDYQSGTFQNPNDDVWAAA